MRPVIQYIQSKDIPDWATIAITLIITIVLNRRLTRECGWLFGYVIEDLLSWIFTRNSAASAQLSTSAEQFVNHSWGYFLTLLFVGCVLSYALRAARQNSDLKARCQQLLDNSAANEEREISNKLSKIQKAQQEQLQARSRLENIVGVNFNKIAEYLASLGTTLEKLETRSDEAHSRQQRALEARKGKHKTKGGE